MVYLTAAIVLTGLLCLLDLVLTLGVIRRLREHTSLLEQAPHNAPVKVGVPAGEVIGEFFARATDGSLVSRALITGPTLVGFFAPGCQPCAEQLPRFIGRAASMPGGSDRVLAVITGRTADSRYVTELIPVAKVVVEEPGGPMHAAFQATGFPSFFLVEAGGRVAASAPFLGALRYPSTTAASPV